MSRVLKISEGPEHFDKGKIDVSDPRVKKLVYSMYRDMLKNRNVEANEFISQKDPNCVSQDLGVIPILESIIRQGSSSGHSTPVNAPVSQPTFSPSSNGPPPPPPMIPSGSIPSVRLSSEVGPLNKGPPSALHGAMMKDKKPFTYTPGGIDLSEIRSPRMAKRIQMNAAAEGVTSVPPPPHSQNITQNIPVATLAAMQPMTHVSVFPQGGIQMPNLHRAPKPSDYASMQNQGTGILAPQHQPQQNMQFSTNQGQRATSPLISPNQNQGIQSPQFSANHNQGMQSPHFSANQNQGLHSPQFSANQNQGMQSPQFSANINQGVQSPQFSANQNQAPQFSANQHHGPPPPPPPEKFLGPAKNDFRPKSPSPQPMSLASLMKQSISGGMHGKNDDDDDGGGVEEIEIIEKGPNTKAQAVSQKIGNIHIPPPPPSQNYSQKITSPEPNYAKSPPTPQRTQEVGNLGALNAQNRAPEQNITKPNVASQPLQIQIAPKNINKNLVRNQSFESDSDTNKSSSPTTPQLNKAPTPWLHSGKNKTNNSGGSPVTIGAHSTPWGPTKGRTILINISKDEGEGENNEANLEPRPNPPRNIPVEVQRNFNTVKTIPISTRGVDGNIEQKQSEGRKVPLTYNIPFTIISGQQSGGGDSPQEQQMKYANEVISDAIQKMTMTKGEESLRGDPIQSKSFKVIKKIADKEEEKFKRAQEELFKRDKRSSDEIFSRESIEYKVDEDESGAKNEEPRFRGGHIPSKAFQTLRNTLPPAPNNPQNRSQGGPVTHTIQISMPVTSYEQSPEPKKYTGANIPSRSFKMLQAMNPPHPDSACEEGASGAEGSLTNINPSYLLPPPTPYYNFYTNEGIEDKNNYLASSIEGVDSQNNNEKISEGENKNNYEEEWANYYWYYCCYWANYWASLGYEVPSPEAFAYFDPMCNYENYGEPNAVENENLDNNEEENDTNSYCQTQKLQNKLEDQNSFHCQSDKLQNNNNSHCQSQSDSNTMNSHCQTTSGNFKNDQYSHCHKLSKNPSEINTHCQQNTKNESIDDDDGDNSSESQKGKNVRLQVSSAKASKSEDFQKTQKLEQGLSPKCKSYKNIQECQRLESIKETKTNPNSIVSKNLLSLPLPKEVKSPELPHISTNKKELDAIISKDKLAPVRKSPILLQDKDVSIIDASLTKNQKSPKVQAKDVSVVTLLTKDKKSSKVQDKDANIIDTSLAKAKKSFKDSDKLVDGIKKSSKAENETDRDKKAKKLDSKEVPALIKPEQNVEKDVSDEVKRRTKRKGQSYERAKTHSRLFDLLQEGEDFEEYTSESSLNLENLVKTETEMTLSLPSAKSSESCLRDSQYESFDSSSSGCSGLLSPALLSPTLKNKNQLVADIITLIQERRKKCDSGRFPSRIFKILQKEFGREFYDVVDLSEEELERQLSRTIQK